ncbi:DUF4870 family protein [Halomonas llamarensis]|uniref:DUF4870 domain-containing protein n=1 Tax=Halomonas llamarensis TaxID=2945104 RepID=A0ABT0SPU1_9GAMM|nr:DUF4870 domain-containing protein [Halomonas llamarensis]MCL7929830.1 hypothetical protein [Halomonas llamarensis]
MREGEENTTPAEGDIISKTGQGPDTTMALVVYALFLASFVVGFTSLIGVVIAYVYRGKGPHWLDEHFRYQIRTFWIGLLYATLFSLLTFVLIGFPLLLALAVWLIVRCVKGFKGLQEKRVPSNVDTWLL